MADLSGAWACDDNGTYQIKELDGGVYWVGEDNREPINGWSNVAHGTRTEDAIDLQWYDTPQGVDSFLGTLKLDIVDDNTLQVAEQTGGFGGTTFTRIT